MCHELPHFSPTGKRKDVIKRAWNPFGKQLLLLIFCLFLFCFYKNLRTQIWDLYSRSGGKNTLQHLLTK